MLSRTSNLEFPFFAHSDETQCMFLQGMGPLSSPHLLTTLGVLTSLVENTAERTEGMFNTHPRYVHYDVKGFHCGILSSGPSPLPARHKTPYIYKSPLKILPPLETSNLLHPLPLHKIILHQSTRTLYIENHGLSVPACLTKPPRSPAGLLSPKSAEGEAPPVVPPPVSAAGKGSGGSPRGRRDARRLTVPPRPPPSPRPPPIMPPARFHGGPLGAARSDFKPRGGDS